MHPDAFAQLRPFAYHLTARANLPSIERTRRLDPAAAIFTRANRQDLLRTRRRGMTTVAVGGRQVLIRDQNPLHPGNCALTHGYSFDDLVELLNSFAYFWTGTDKCPVSSGVNHFKRYARIEDVVVPWQNIEVSTPTRRGTRFPAPTLSE